MVFSMIISDVSIKNDDSEDDYNYDYDYDYNYDYNYDKNKVEYFYEDLLNSIRLYPLIFPLPVYPLIISFFFRSK